MDAALRAVHSAALCAVAVIGHLSRQAGEHRALCRLESECRHSRCVLAEVYNQSLTLIQGNCLACSIFALYYNLAVSIFSSAFCLFPNISLDRLKCNVLPLINLCSRRRNNLSGELFINLRGGKKFRSFKAKGLARIVFLSVKNGRMLYRACNAGRPVLCIGTEQLNAAIGINQLQNRAECTFLTNHAGVATGGKDLVGPPAGGHLRRKDILRIGLLVKGLRHIVCKGNLRLLIMGKTGLQDLLAHKPAIQVDVVHTKTGGHPFGALYRLFILYRCQEPAASVRRPAIMVILHNLCKHGGIDCRYPLRCFPCGIIQCRCSYTYKFFSLTAGCDCCGHNACCDKFNEGFHGGFALRCKIRKIDLTC